MSVTPEQEQEIPGQQTIDEATPSATEILEEGDGPTPEADAASDDDDPAEPVKADGNDADAEPDPTRADASAVESTGDSADVVAGASGAKSTEDKPTDHRFRVVHEQSNPGSEMAHSSSTSAPMVLQEAIDYLVKLAAKFLL